MRNANHVLQQRSRGERLSIGVWSSHIQWCGVDRVGQRSGMIYTIERTAAAIQRLGREAILDGRYIAVWWLINRRNTGLVHMLGSGSALNLFNSHLVQLLIVCHERFWTLKPTIYMLWQYKFSYQEAELHLLRNAKYVTWWYSRNQSKH